MRSILYRFPSSSRKTEDGIVFPTTLINKSNRSPTGAFSGVETSSNLNGAGGTNDVRCCINLSAGSETTPGLQSKTATRITTGPIAYFRYFAFSLKSIAFVKETGPSSAVLWSMLARRSATFAPPVSGFPSTCL